MAYDIGPKLGIDGFADFKSSIAYINEEVKGLGSELKLVAAVYDENGQSMEALTEQNKILEKTYDAQERKIAEVSKLLERARAEYGENSESVKKWERVLTDSKTALQNTKNAIEKNNRAMSELGDSAKKSSSKFDALKDAAGKALEKIGDSAKKAADKLDVMKVAAGNLVSDGISAIAGAVGDAVSTFVNLDESTEEYRTAMGKLNAAFEAGSKSMNNSIVSHGKFEAVLMDTGDAVDKSWHTAEKAAEVYKGLYAILGDTDSAVESAQLMVQLAESEEDFAHWTRIAAGVSGTFGDALPINSLIEAANETVKVGEVTGALADALNWAGISEDEFNEKLAACTSESERNDLIMGTLTDTYKDAADAFYRNNEQLVKSRENQVMLDEVTGRLGETVAEVKNTMLEKFGPAIAEIGENIAEFIEGVDTDELFKKFDTAYKEITRVWDGAEPYFGLLRNILGGTFDTLANVWVGDFEGAWNNVKEVFSDARTFFDNLGEDIADALAAGAARRHREENAGGFGNDAERAGAFGGATNYGQQYESWLAPNSGGNVYLDGKKVGRVLGELNSSEMVAAGADISTLP